MSAQGNIIAFDGAGTPVSHTLVAIGTGVDVKFGNIARWREQLTTVPMMANIRATSLQKTLKNGFDRVEVRLEVPTMESVNGQNAGGYTAAPKVAYVDTGSLVFYFSPRTPIAQRRLVRQLLLNIGGAIATSVTPVTTGAVPELVDGGITAS